MYSPSVTTILNETKHRHDLTIKRILKLKPIYQVLRTQLASNSNVTLVDLSSDGRFIQIDLLVQNFKEVLPILEELDKLKIRITSTYDDASGLGRRYHGAGVVIWTWLNKNAKCKKVQTGLTPVYKLVCE